MFNLWFAIAFAWLAIFEFAGNTKYHMWFRIPVICILGFLAGMNLMWAIRHYEAQGLL